MAGERILIVDSDRSTLSFLAAMFTQEGYDVITAMLGREAREKLKVFQPDLLITERRLPDLEVMDLVQELRRDPAMSSLNVIVFSDATDVTEIVSYLKAGADEHITKRPGADREVLARARLLLAKRTEPAPSESTPGKLISFFSAKGGTGTSAVCAHFACVLAERIKPRTVSLVDLVLPLGSMRQILGVDSPESIATLTQLSEDRINSASVSRALTRAEGWDVRALLGARDPAEAQSLRVAPLEAIFDVLCALFDYTLVDFGRSLSRVSLPLIQKSQMIVVVMGPDVNTVHLTRTCLEYFASLDIPSTHLFLVINRAVGLAGLTKDQIENTLHLPVAGTIPYGGADFTLLLNQSKPFVRVHENTPLAIAMRELVDMLQARVDRVK